MKRPDDFESRRKHLEDLSDEKLKNLFWELAEKITTPLVDLAKTHTSPAVERSVLLRMGFSSMEAKEIVEQTIDHGYIGKGSGHVVWKLAKEKNQDYRVIGRELAEGKHWDEIDRLFGRS